MSIYTDMTKDKFTEWAWIHTHTHKERVQQAKFWKRKTLESSGARYQDLGMCECDPLN